MLILGTKNIGTQTVLTDGIINLGSTYRRFCKNNAFARTSNDISLQATGVYHITATLVGSGDVAGVVTVQLAINGELVDGAFSSETITTADTELRTFVIDYYALVDKSCVLGSTAVNTQTVSLVNTGVDATFTSVIVNVDKVV